MQGIPCNLIGIYRNTNDNFCSKLLVIGGIITDSPGVWNITRCDIPFHLDLNLFSSAFCIQ